MQVCIFVWLVSLCLNPDTAEKKPPKKYIFIIGLFGCNYSSYAHDLFCGTKNLHSWRLGNNGVINSRHLGCPCSSRKVKLSIIESPEASLSSYIQPKRGSPRQQIENPRWSPSRGALPSAPCPPCVIRNTWAPWRRLFLQCASTGHIGSNCDTRAAGCQVNWKELLIRFLGD